MLTKLTALSLAAVAYVNCQAFANVEERGFLNDFEIYPVQKRLEQAFLTNDTINNNDNNKWKWIIQNMTINGTYNATINDYNGNKWKWIIENQSANQTTNATIYSNDDSNWDWIYQNTTVNQTTHATINNHDSVSKTIFDDSFTGAVIFGWGPDYEGISPVPVTNEIKFKCNLLVDLIYFYNIVPLHGQEYTISSAEGDIHMVFCDQMTSDALIALGCEGNL